MPAKSPSRKKLIILVVMGLSLPFAVLLSLTSFDLPLNPKTNQETLFFDFLFVVIFLLFVALTFVLVRNLLKLTAERRLGVLGSKFRSRMVVASLLLSFLPVIVMFLFAYVLMNRSIDKWFSSPVEEVRQDTAHMTSLLSRYAAQNARAEAVSIANSPETQRAFTANSFGAVVTEFRKHEPTLQSGFVFALSSGNAEASFGTQVPWATLKSKIPQDQLASGTFQPVNLDQAEYAIGVATVGNHGIILVAMPLPKAFSETVRQSEANQERYLELSRERRQLRRTYMGLLLLLTVLVLFASTWLALFLSKLVTRPVAALAEATQEISRGRLDYRVEISAADEIGDLVRSFNRMAEELETSRGQIEASSQKLELANVALEQRRQHIETILESIPTGVLSLNAERRITHVNQALLRLFHPMREDSGAPAILIGARISEVFSPEILADLEPLLRRADRMGTTTTQMEIDVQRSRLNVATTVATLHHEEERLGYVLVFEDLSDLLKAQKQTAWREVARRVAHEIKNPLTPIALSAERIHRHLDRGTPPDAASLRVIDSCAQTIAGAVETVRTLVDEFSTLARFPTAQPQPASINLIVENVLSMFDGRLDGIRVYTSLTADLPKAMADPEGMKRALANLVDNAAEAMQDSVLREIHISTALVASRDAIELTVSDTGHGVSQELKERLFLPYFSTKQRGTGLGLAIVNRIIEDHHGSIRVEENDPVGTKFIIELPVVAEAVDVSPITKHA
ncbi:MAG: multi-sensor signal transduction histidine kinase [Acidobacteriaceae bacterium]|jgi:two-component system nitrogen regulation sensor histidine kinase NtrY|nr:multi-sensor signal transduction histidine kinase [Acidobacteriaceae bacterium]